MGIALPGWSAQGALLPARGVEPQGFTGPDSGPGQCQGPGPGQQGAAHTTPYNHRRNSPQSSYRHPPSRCVLQHLPDLRLRCLLGSGLQPRQPLRGGNHGDRAPHLLLPGIAHDLHRLGIRKLRRETEQGPVG